MSDERMRRETLTSGEEPATATIPTKGSLHGPLILHINDRKCSNANTRRRHISASSADIKCTKIIRAEKHAVKTTSWYTYTVHLTTTTLTTKRRIITRPNFETDNRLCLLQPQSK